MTFSHKQQRGSTLLVALIMLVLLTLIAVSAINSTTASIQMVGNAQVREESASVAQQGIEGMLSYNFTAAPAASAISVDINNDGTPDYVGQVNMPTCISSIPLTNAQLNFAVAADQQCASSDKKTNTGIIGASGVVATTQSWCYKQTWELSATVADNVTGANTTVHQGVYIRVPTGTACP